MKSGPFCRRAAAAAAEAERRKRARVRRELALEARRQEKRDREERDRERGFACPLRMAELRAKRQAAAWRAGQRREALGKRRRAAWDGWEAANGDVVSGAALDAGTPEALELRAACEAATRAVRPRPAWATGSGEEVSMAEAEQAEAMEMVEQMEVEAGGAAAPAVARAARAAADRRVARTRGARAAKLMAAAGGGVGEAGRVPPVSP